MNFVLLVLGLANAWELYGSNVAYDKGTTLSIKGASISSMAGPYYPFYEGPFCQPKSGLGIGQDYLGEILMGSRLVNTPLEVTILEKTKCVPLCDDPVQFPEGGPKVSPGETLILNPEIGNSDLRKFPRAEVLIDTLPIISKVQYTSLPFYLKAMIGKRDKDEQFYTHGVPIYDGIGIIQNHWKVNLQVEQVTAYHIEGGFFGLGGTSKEQKRYVIVGATIETNSVANVAECMLAEPKPFDAKDATTGQWYASVNWEIVDHTTYTTRWNKAISAIQYGLATLDGKSAFPLQEMANEKKWFDVLLDTSLLACFLVFTVALLMARMLKRDFDKEDDTLLGEDLSDMSTWKLLKSDVFRKPAHSTILCALVGGGLQILGALVPVALAVIFGIIPEEHKGRIVQLMIVSWAVMGLPSSYVVCRLYKMFESPNWKLTVVRTGLLVPGSLLAVALGINGATKFLSLFNSSSVPRILDYWAITRLVLFWVFFSLPLIGLGCFLGMKAEGTEFPVKPSKIPRPSSGISASYTVVIFAAGALIHASSMALVDAVLRMLFHDYTQDHIFSVAMTACVWTVLTAMTSVCATFYIINEDVWEWWWYAFLAPASSGVWIALLLLLEAQVRVHNILEMIVYSGVVLIVSSAFGLVAGSIGFLASLGFVWAIYSQIKCD